MIRILSRCALAALVFTATAAATSNTAEAQRPQVGIGGGVTFPVSDLSDTQAAGWHGLVTMGARPALFPVGFRLDGMYHRLGGENIPGTLDLQTIALTGNILIEAPGMAVKPYLIGGVGLYNNKSRGGAEASRNNFGLNGGAGLKFRFFEFDTFVEGRYHAALNALGPEGDRRAAQLVPVTFGISF